MLIYEICLVVITVILLAVYGRIIWILGLGFKKAISGPMPAENTTTRISILIPFRNEENHLSDIFHDIVAQDYPNDLYEVIFIDDHSVDNGINMLRSLLKDDKKRPVIRVISLAEQGSGNGSKKEAITLGVDFAEGDLIVITDADCRVRRNWLKIISSNYAEFGPRFLIGPVIYSTSRGWWSGFYRMEFMSLVAAGAGAAGAGKPFLANGANMAYEKELFRELDGYVSNRKYASGDDVFLLQETAKIYGPGSVRFINDADAIVETDPPETMPEFIKQRMRWAGKSRGYRDVFGLKTAAVVFLLHFWMLTMIISGILSYRLMVAFVVIFAIKTVIDSGFTGLITRFFKEKIHPAGFILYELVYIPYIVFTAIASLVFSKDWKGRKIRA